MAINTQVCADIRTELNKALALVCQKHGLTSTLGTIRYTPDVNARMTVQFFAAVPAIVQGKEPAMAIGTRFRWNTRDYTYVGRSNGRKYKYSVERDDGRRYTMSDVHLRGVHVYT